jgi:hypothetical protein
MLKIIPSFPQCVVIADTQSYRNPLLPELLRLLKVLKFGDRQFAIRFEHAHETQNTIYT